MTITLNTTARRQLTAKIASLTNDQLLAGVVAIGGGYVSEDRRLVRAMLLEEISTRDGADAADLVMDSIGL